MRREECGGRREDRTGESGYDPAMCAKIFGWLAALSLAMLVLVMTCALSPRFARNFERHPSITTGERTWSLELWGSGMVPDLQIAWFNSLPEPLHSPLPLNSPAAAAWRTKMKSPWCSQLSLGIMTENAAVFTGKDADTVPGFVSRAAVPIWYPLIATAILPILYLPRRMRRRRQVRWVTRGQCCACGFDLRASGDRCPECGIATNARPVPTAMSLLARRVRPYISRAPGTPAWTHPLLPLLLSATAVAVLVLTDLLIDPDFFYAPGSAYFVAASLPPLPAIVLAMALLIVGISLGAAISVRSWDAIPFIGLIVNLALLTQMCLVCRPLVQPVPEHPLPVARHVARPA